MVEFQCEDVRERLFPSDTFGISKYLNFLHPLVKWGRERLEGCIVGNRVECVRKFSNGTSNVTSNFTQKILQRIKEDFPTRETENFVIVF